MNKWLYDAVDEGRTERSVLSFIYQSVSSNARTPLLGYAWGNITMGGKTAQNNTQHLSGKMMGKKNQTWSS